MDIRGLAGAAFNGAKERALDGFIAGQIRFTDMAGVVEDVLDTLSAKGGLENAAITLDAVREVDQVSRIYAAEAIEARAASTAGLRR